MTSVIVVKGHFLNTFHVMFVDHCFISTQNMKAHGNMFKATLRILLRNNGRPAAAVCLYVRFCTPEITVW